MTEKGAEVSLNALALGAVDIVAKPREDLANTLQAYSEEIITKVKAAVRANIYAIEKSVKARNIEQKLSADAVIAKQATDHFNNTEKLIAIGASTGGTEAIKDILVRLPADAPGIVIAQHIPGAFSSAFAERMNLLSKMVVCEARDGDPILCGHVYIAPGSQHLLIKRVGNHYVCQLHDGPPVNRHKPSVDVLFRSVAQCAGPNAIGVILTGMGDDGARGLKEMHEAGAPAIAQDEKSSIVWGMPGEAVRVGAVDDIVTLEQISTKVLQYC
jgi:two-component system chemotaxis response regulator CheB